MSRERQIAFALWCIDVLKRQFGAYLSQKAGDARSVALNGLLDGLWHDVVRGDPVPVATTLDAFLSEVDWEPDEVQADQEDSSFGALGILDLLVRLRDALLGASPERVAEMATVLIDQAGYEVEAILGESAFDPEHPRVTQQAMKIDDILGILGRAAGPPPDLRGK